MHRDARLCNSLQVNFRKRLIVVSECICKTWPGWVRPHSAICIGELGIRCVCSVVASLYAQRKKATHIATWEKVVLTKE
jgi:hypothetical protein